MRVIMRGWRKKQYVVKLFNSGVCSAISGRSGDCGGDGGFDCIGLSKAQLYVLLSLAYHYGVGEGAYDDFADRREIRRRIRRLSGLERDAESDGRECGNQSAHPPQRVLFRCRSICRRGAAASFGGGKIKIGKNAGQSRIFKRYLYIDAFI